MGAPKKLESLFKEYQSPGVVQKSEQYANWTLPAVYADNTTNRPVDRATLAYDWQSFNGQLVNYLAAKLAALLFPVGRSFFRMDPDEEQFALFSAATGVQAEAARALMTKVERTSCARLYDRGNYSRLIQLLKLLIITGDGLILRADDGRILVYNTRQYSILRDGTGQPLHVILCDRRAWSRLPPEVQRIVPEKPDTELVNVYTSGKYSVTADGKRWCTVHQECGEWRGADMAYREEVSPFIPCAWELSLGESYGRGLVEANAGDIAKYSALSKALALYEIQAAHVINCVRKGSSVDLDELLDAECGAFVWGDPDAIKPHEGGDALKIRELQATLSVLEVRLGKAFMYSGQVRDSERTTAYEIARDAQEAELSNGGTYSSLSQALHIPLAYLQLQREFPEFVVALLDSGMQLQVTTGLATLGRSGDIQGWLRAASSAQGIIQALAPLSAKVSAERIIDMCIQAEGLDPNEGYKTEEELQEAEQANAPINPMDAAGMTALSGVISQNG